jgi:N utilization substance protein B
MTRRSRAREVALQLLFERDLNAQPSRNEVERFAKSRLREKEMSRYCLALYDGIAARQTEIDQRISEAADNWRLPRMAAVDRNALRMGAFELLYCPEVPPAVAFDEVIELARRFGSVDSPAFVNGVLDRIRRGIEPAPGERTNASTSRPPC